jgi:hypothetical protein
MAIIYSYPIATPESQDLLVGTEMAIQGGEDSPRTRTFTIGSIIDLIKPYKVYTALLSQTGEEAPTTIVLENTIGNIIWSYNDVGQYKGTLSNAFPEQETALFITNTTYNSTSNAYFLTNGTADSVVVETYNAANTSRTDGKLGLTTIEIRVYN